MSSRDLKVLFIVFVNLFLIILAAPDEDGDVQLVSVIFRHGARTPSSFYKNDPHKNKTFYPYGPGQLTNEGKMQEFVLGKFLHDTYIKFLGEDYTETKIQTRSTDYARTKMSAELVLAGLFPPSKLLTWNKDLPWQPIPVNYLPDLEEDLFTPYLNCSFKDKVIDALPKIPDVQEKFIKPFADVYKIVKDGTGEELKTPPEIMELFETIKAEADLNLTLPAWAQKIFPDKLHAAASASPPFYNYNPEVVKINSGYMLKKILDDSQDKIKNPKSERKIFLYSGHESTVGSMLDALNVTEWHVPAYGSAFMLELRQKTDKYFIKMSYRNSTDATVAQDLQIDGCDVLCPFDEFLKLVKYMLPTKSLEEA